jgi:membrane-associated phospholipid phosphatase
VSAADEAGERPAASWLCRLQANARDTMATLFRAPRPPDRRILYPASPRLAGTALLAIAAVIAAMLVLDGFSLAFVRRLPPAVREAFERLTQFGLSGWFLWPLLVMLLGLAAINAWTLPRYTRMVLAALAVRLGFLFTAIGVPGLFVTTVKRLIGRARPLIDGNDIWSYQPLGWQVQYASLPSGHATTAFSALVAFGAIFPEARALLWIYAVLIAVSRVVVTAHHPSDVVAGAIVGSVGALLVRNWFAARRLGFLVGSDGVVRTLPGPSMRHLKAAARRVVARLSG